MSETGPSEGSTRSGGLARAGRIALASLEWSAVIVIGLLLLVLVGLFGLLWWPYEAPALVGIGQPPATTGKPDKTGSAANSSMPGSTNPSGSKSNGTPHNVASAAPSSSSATPAVAITDDRSSAALFAPIAQVLQSPRCMNCHPAGDRPLWRDGQEHSMNLSRTSFDSGLACQTCHQQRNADELGIRGGPPGAPHWQLPPKETPMVFQDRSSAALCRQLRDPAHNGGKTLQALLHHVEEDPLVLWAWNPGGDRSPPPLSHAAFIKAFEAWVAAEGRCAGDPIEEDGE